LNLEKVELDVNICQYKISQQPTMATCHAGKNLREENRDGKAAALVFVK
jgi:hypothetical protein